MSHFRWIATVKYRTDTGITEVDHQFEEMFDLHNLIEQGPSWDCIESIQVEPNPRRRAYDDTVDKSLRRKLSGRTFSLLPMPSNTILPFFTLGPSGEDRSSPWADLAAIRADAPPETSGGVISSSSIDNIQCLAMLRQLRTRSGHTSQF